MGRDSEVFTAIFRPLHGTAQFACSKADERFVRVDGDLTAKSAPDVRGDNLQLRFRYPEHPGQNKAVDVRVLRGAPDGHLAARRIVTRSGGTHLHRIRNEPLLAETLSHDDFRLLEHVICHFARTPVVRQVVRHVLVQ